MISADEFHRTWDFSGAHRTLPHPLVPTFFSLRQGLVVSTCSKGGRPSLLGVAWQHQAPSLLQSKRCWTFAQGGVFVFRTQAAGEGSSGSVLGSKYKEKSDRAHIHQLESFCLTFATPCVSFGNSELS